MSKFKEWLKRYLPANILSTIITLLTVLIVLKLTGNNVLAAFLGSIFESIAYYGFILTRDVIETKKKYSKEKRKYTTKSFLKNIRNLFLEFGLAEIMDTLIIRPFFLYVCPIVLGSVTIGTLVGKYIADILFYIPTIISYEMRKKHLKD